MNRPLLVRPDSFQQFGTPADTFCLVTDEELMDEFVLDHGDPDGGTNGGQAGHRSFIVPVRAGADLGKVLVQDVPEEADIVVICRRSFLSSPDEALIGPGRRMVVMPCASTPVSREQIRYFLGVVARTDAAAQAARADRFFQDVEASGGLRLVDDAQATSCEFDPLGEHYVWNQQAGYLGPGEQQIVPTGELSVLPMEITDFDPDLTLALTGRLTLRGLPIVHGGYDQALAGEQDRLFNRLTPMHRHPVVLTVRDGVIVETRPGEQSGEAAEVVAALEELFAEDPRYRTVWELGFGINTAMETVPANCGLNEPYGASDGIVHLGIGLTPFTRFALTFLCRGTVLISGSTGNTVLGSAPRTRRLKRTYTASCGCH